MSSSRENSPDWLCSFLKHKGGWLECAGLESLLLPIMCFSLLVSGDGVKVDEEMSKLLPSQKNKMRQKQRKAEARAKKGAEEKNEELSASEVSKSRKRHVKLVNPDPHGEKLLQVDAPLSEATKYLKLLQKNSPDSLETLLLFFELYTRKQKVLLTFQGQRIKATIRKSSIYCNNFHIWMVERMKKKKAFLSGIWHQAKVVYVLIDVRYDQWNWVCD
ncbi:uncharacterized protein LOC130734280 [Lotus japonicus]|uniref:uncharacterized protein LOC130734280 n=1 Tax=Lotus japonicus TaxID=34305 RepID=UPI00258DE88C|nr:uncharacterized protein LOC130734280 [Lotus japonicus]XP_057442614.1 uncharacterized protein LOC130734280 [Lotus japonicus]